MTGKSIASWFDVDGELSHGGRCPVVFFRINDEEYVLKHYARGGFAAKFTVDRYLYLGQSQVRSYMEWRLLQQMYQNQLPVPLPVAARYRREGAFYTADLITRSCRPARPVSEILKERALSEHEWHTIGTTIKKFHDFNIDHPDMNVSNFLLDENNKRIILLDFDKARQGKLSQWRQKANLKRLVRSMNKLRTDYPKDRLTEVHIRALYAGWGQHP